MKVIIFWGAMPCSLVEATYVSEACAVSALKAEEQAKTATSEHVSSLRFSSENSLRISWFHQISYIF
jgi:hypothetical protein